MTLLHRVLTFICRNSINTGLSSSTTKATLSPARSIAIYIFKSMNFPSKIGTNASLARTTSLIVTNFARSDVSLRMMSIQNSLRYKNLKDQKHYAFVSVQPIFLTRFPKKYTKGRLNPQ